LANQKKIEALLMQLQIRTQNISFSLQLTNVPISWSVTFHLAGKACEGQMLKLIRLTSKLQRKLIAFDMAPPGHIISKLQRK